MKIKASKMKMNNILFQFVMKSFLDLTKQADVSQQEKCVT